jgi:glycerol-3-phosphate acyltransferase PlsY
VAKLSHYVSLASISAAATLPLWLLLTVEGLSDVPGRHAAAVPFYGVVCALSAVVILKHRPNIQRLLHGCENRIGQRANSPAHPARAEGPPKGSGNP